LAALFDLPLDVAKDLYVHPIAEAIREATGSKMPRLEIILSYAAFLLPLLAAVSALYLYHKLYLAKETRELKVKYQYIRDADEREPINLKMIAAMIFLIIFIPGVLYTGYKDKFTAPLLPALKYSELSHLSNLELRDRALRVSQKLSDLVKQYVARQDGITAEYRKARLAYDDADTEFQRKKTDYENAVRTCPYLPLGQSPLGPFNQGIVVQPSIGVIQPTCSIPSVPVPPQEPHYPVIPVDSQWKDETEKTEEEAAAIWEELRHRAGGYTNFFEVPSTYNDKSSVLSESAKSLAETANRLQ